MLPADHIMFSPGAGTLLSLQGVYESAVEYFGESCKSTPPSMFFPMLVRFIKAYKVRLGSSHCQGLYQRSLQQFDSSLCLH